LIFLLISSAECGFCCHRRCLNFITRTCASQKVCLLVTFSCSKARGFTFPENGNHGSMWRQATAAGKNILIYEDAC